MKKLFALVAVLLAVCIVPNDVDAQTRKEKKASKKATVQSRGTKLVREECEELAMDSMGVLMVKKKAKEFYYRHFQGFNTLLVRI